MCKELYIHRKATPEERKQVPEAYTWCRVTRMFHKRNGQPIKEERNEQKTT